MGARAAELLGSTLEMMEDALLRATLKASNSCSTDFDVNPPSHSIAKNNRFSITGESDGVVLY